MMGALQVVKPGLLTSVQDLGRYGYQASGVEVLGAMDPDGGRLSNRIWGCFSGRLKRVPGRNPEPGIEVIEWTVEELYQASNNGPFDHALHVAIVLQAILQGKLPAPVLNQ